MTLKVTDKLTTSTIGYFSDSWAFCFASRMISQKVTDGYSWNFFWKFRPNRDGFVGDLNGIEGFFTVAR